MKIKENCVAKVSDLFVSKWDFRKAQFHSLFSNVTCIGTTQPGGSYDPNSGKFIAESGSGCNEISFLFDSRSNRILRIVYKSGHSPMFGLNLIEFRTYEEAKLFKNAMNSTNTYFVLKSRGCSESGQCFSSATDNFKLVALHKGNTEISRDDLLRELAKANTCSSISASRILCNGILYERVIAK